MTISISQTDQSKDMKNTLISIGTHQLSFSISGEPRAPHKPLVVIIPGSGDVASSYIALEPLVAQFAQILLYDRSGLGNSQRGPSSPLAVTSAIELHKLLQAIKQQPPFLLAAHSYGGIIAREYYHLYPNEVCGMALFDTATERNLEYFQVPDPNIAAVLGNLKVALVTGLRADAKLSRDQWRQRAIDMARGDETAQAEADGDAVMEVCRALAEKKQLDRQAMGNKPLSIIRCNSARDYERIYAAGVEAGNGTEAQQRAFRRTLDQWDSAMQDLSIDQLRLSSKTHFIYLHDCGHNVQLVRPDVIAGEIKWVLDQVRRGREVQRL
jgi:pimeloyl-ACP methyl ester carboxylesterase